VTSQQVHTRSLATWQQAAHQGIHLSSQPTYGTQPLTTNATATWYKTQAGLIQSVRSSSSSSVSHDAAIAFTGQRIGGIEIAKKIIKEEGIRGLYR
jgi:hypothetical protein